MSVLIEAEAVAGQQRLDQMFMASLGEEVVEASGAADGDQAYRSSA